PSKTDNLQHATLFIVIGGNTLSRGLTLEGLTTSYFMRNTITSDTLMQMGRWFGYRFGYELFPRIWLNSLVRDRFGWVTQIDEELREEIKEFNRIGLLPKDVGIKVTNSPNNALLKLTSNNKMQNSLETDLNFEGVQKQTIVFEDDSEVLQSNIRIADEFLNGLDQPIPNGNRLVWHKVP
ncbi:Z1 domain-containing protein, partial [Micrococcus sp. SIMBA_144]